MEIGQFAFTECVDHTMGFGAAYSVDEQRSSHVLHQPTDRILGDVGVRYDELGHIDLSDSFGKPFGCDQADCFRIRDCSNHLSCLIMQAEINTASLRRLAFGQMYVYTLLLAVVMHQSSEEITAENGQ